MVLTRSAAEAALASLLGMGLDYAPALDRHDARRKMGVITRAEIVGKHLNWADICSPRISPRSCGKSPMAASAGVQAPPIDAY